MYDLKIINGTILDGTGAPARRADIGIRDGHIVALGSCGDEEAVRTIDAQGLIVTPGFIDIHCHYDGQVSWDADLAPSSLHGVTTCVMGSCGVGFAPVRPEDHERLIQLMEGVEDIPGAALAEGIPWGWESFPEYMDVIDSFPHTIDFMTQLTHDALRVYVMGDRGVANEVASDEDIARMRTLVREALEAGAIGFSTGRTDNHRAADGSATPASEATARELEGIARGFVGLDHRVLQAVSDFDMALDESRFQDEFDVLERMAEAAGGHPMSISLMQRDQAPDQWRDIIKRAEQAQARGLNIKLQVADRAIGVLLGFQATFHPFMGYPTYKSLLHLSLPERIERLRDPELKAKLLAETPDKVAGDGSPIPPLADTLLAAMEFVSARIFRLGERPDYEPPLEESLFMEAKRRGVPVLECLLDAMMEHDGKELLYFPLYNYQRGNLDDVYEMLQHPLALSGLSDGGAHVGTVCDASMPTFMLTHWARDREQGFELPHAVHLLTQRNAQHLGLTDRGVIAVGKRADLNLIDHDKLHLTRPYLVRDLPAGGQRLLQDAHGYHCTMVRGEIIAQDGKLTGARPGRLVRAGA